MPTRSRKTNVTSRLEIPTPVSSEGSISKTTSPASAIPADGLDPGRPLPNGLPPVVANTSVMISVPCSSFNSLRYSSTCFSIRSMCFWVASKVVPAGIANLIFTLSRGRRSPRITPTKMKSKAIKRAAAPYLNLRQKCKRGL